MSLPDATRFEKGAKRIRPKSSPSANGGPTVLTLRLGTPTAGPGGSSESGPGDSSERPAGGERSDRGPRSPQTSRRTLSPLLRQVTTIIPPSPDGNGGATLEVVVTGGDYDDGWTADPGDLPELSQAGWVRFGVDQAMVHVRVIS